MTICALQYLIKQNIKFDNLIKISGRYYLSENFDYNKFTNDKIVIKYIENNKNNVLTSLYKLPYEYIVTFKIFLINNVYKMNNCIGYEVETVLFAEFIKKLKNTSINNHEIIGIAGFISVSTDFYNG